MSDSLYKNYLNLLKEAIQIKSISTNSTYRNEINKMATWCNNLITDIDFDVKVFYDYGNPIILATYVVSEEAETVLHYGHYDVQPAEESDEWFGYPFELFEDENKLYGRGVADNKGQFLIYVTVLENLIKSNQLKYNVKFILEGNEETGSAGLSKFIKDNKEILNSTFTIISDGELIGKHPTIEASYRGVFNVEVKIYGPKNELHSGLFGGVVYNPANTLIKVLQDLTNEVGEVKIFDDLNGEPSENDLKRIKNNPFSLDDFVKATGYTEPIIKNNVEYYQKLGFTNTAQITGIESGYNKEGFKNAIPTTATVKLNFRLNPYIDPNIAKERVERYFKEKIPSSLKYDISFSSLAHGIIMNLDNKYANKAVKLLEKTYKEKVAYNYCGAIVPIAYDIDKLLNIPTLFIDFANSDCMMHAVNENLEKDLIKKALNFSYEYLST